jgi:hypothetical protein
MAKKVDAIEPSSFKTELRKLVKKHDKVVVIFRDYDAGFRKRLISSDGSCVVSYKGQGYRKWTRYQKSCFMDYAHQTERKYDRWGNISIILNRKAKATLNKTIREMLEHDDGDDISPLEIRYGRGFKKKLYIVDMVR